jgi:hypothetical protein
MDPNRLDDLAKAVASTSSRRQALKAFGASAVAFLFAGIRGGGAEAHHDPPCRDAGSNCRSNAECCDRVCFDFHCGCPDGLVVCQGECVRPCPATFVLNPTTCACECPPGTEECQGTCVLECPAGQTRNPQTCECESPPVACEEFQCGDTAILCGETGECLCTRSVEGLSTCGSNFTCGATPTCTSSAECVAQGFLFCQAQGTGCCGQVCVPACGTSAVFSATSLGPTNKRK